MTRILFISSYLNRAGTEAFMMNVFRHLDTQRFHVDFLIFTEAETDYSREIEARGSQVWRLISRRKGWLTYYCALREFFKTHKGEYDVVHWCGNSLSSMAPLCYAWRAGVPIRIVHGHNSSTSGCHNRFLHRLFRRFTEAITTHHLACSTAAAHWFFGNRPAIIIKNGINLTTFAFQPEIRNRIRREWNVREDCEILGHIGRFCTEKNHPYLLRLFQRYHILHPNSLLVLIGDGENKQECMQIAETLGIADSTLFLGERCDVPELLQAIDCFVMPSLFEGLPFVLVEAQAAGLSCVCADTICHDIQLTQAVHFLSLDSPMDDWCHTIYDCTQAPRITDIEALIKAGYDLDNTLKQLESIYQ